MKKLAVVTLLVLALCAMAFPQAKPGGIARQAAMGGSQAGSGLVLNPFIMEDPSLMLVNPAYQAMYKDYGWSNLSGGQLQGLSTANNGYGQQNAGIAFGLNDSWNVGAIFSYDPSAVNLVSAFAYDYGTPQPTGAALSIPAVNNVWELVASTRMSSMDLGLGVMYGWSSTSLEATTTTPTSQSGKSEASANVLGFRAGLNYDLGGGSSLDGTAAFRLDNASREITFSPTVNGTGGEYSASGTEFEIFLRAKLKRSEKFNFVPYAALMLGSAEPKEDATPTGGTATTEKSNYSATGMALGLGGEYRVNGFYFAGGVSWQSLEAKFENTPNGAGATKTTTTDTYSGLPVFNAGGEWWFLDWLAGRMGYYRSIGKVTTKTETTTGTTEISSSSGLNLPIIGPFPGTFSNIIVGGLNPATWDGLVTLGLGMKFGGFALDATVSEEALRRGLGLIGGQDGINTFGYMTASYNFAE